MSRHKENFGSADRITNLPKFNLEAIATEVSQIVGALDTQVAQCLILLKISGKVLSNQEFSRILTYVNNARKILSAKRKFITRQKKYVNESELTDLFRQEVELDEVETNFLVKLRSQGSLENYLTIDQALIYFSQVELFATQLNQLGSPIHNYLPVPPEVKVIDNILQVIKQSNGFIASLENQEDRDFLEFYQLKLKDLALLIQETTEVYFGTEKPKSLNLDDFIQKLAGIMKLLGMSLASLGLPGLMAKDVKLPLEPRVRVNWGEEWSKDFIEIEVWTRKLNGARDRLVLHLFIAGDRKVFTQSESGEYFTEPRKLSRSDTRKFDLARKLYNGLIEDPNNQHLLIRVIDNVGVSKSVSASVKEKRQNVVG